MIVRICPMCDSEMKKAHYCDACHTWIWKPQMLDVHYNTETRGLGEVDCAYGDVHDALDHPGYDSGDKKQAERNRREQQAIKRRELLEQRRQARDGALYEKKPAREKASPKNDGKKKATLYLVIAIIIIVIEMLLTNS